MPKHRLCNICQKPVVLSPSANERARKHGETPKFYLDLFPAHAHCIVTKRARETSELLKRTTYTNPKT